MTVAEFLEWDSGDRSGRPWQLVDGEPLAMSPPSLVHGVIQGNFIALVHPHLRARAPGCTVVVAPGVVPRIRSRENFRVPDIGVTCSSNLAGTMMPDPVLLVEILSPNNEAETRAAIWSYTTIPSVQEILVLHSTRVEAELLRRDGRDWPAGPETVHADGTLTLSSIGFSVPLAAIYRTSGLVLAGSQDQRRE